VIGDHHGPAHTAALLAVDSLDVLADPLLAVLFVHVARSLNLASC
jgi:hypothetical protein